MGDIKGFLKIARQDSNRRSPEERVCDYKDVCKTRPLEQSREQAARCMDCATPFCHWSCPVGNYIPEWNDLASCGDWRKASMMLEAANNLPEITGRVCPGLCEYACVLGVNDDAVTVRENELCIVERAFEEGFIKPILPNKRTEKTIAVIGSGPAGISCAAQLNRAGHKVTVFERDKKVGGILRYGIPDFKLEKHIIDRRIDLWKKEGVIFKTGVEVGKDLPAKELLKEFDVSLLACGSRVPRDLNIEGRELKGVHFAMDYLTGANKKVSGELNASKKTIDAKNKKVIVIGGGDTGADCVGTAKR
ncbi:MAG: glutamate synthase subunit beta, partial [Candidatus Omnitrophota bacterium]